MSDVLVFTANYGGRDRVQVPCPQDMDVDWLYITGDPTLYPPAPWFVLHAAPTEAHPNMAAKWHRTHPPLSLPGGQPYKYMIWIDANMEITDPSFARKAIACVNDGIALWDHPRRDNILDEVEASLGAEGQGGRYDDLPMREQAAAYFALGYPNDFGLYATGTIVWTPERVADVGAAWFEECKRWGYQDQISFPFVCWAYGIKPGVFPIHQTEGKFNGRRGFWTNGWMRIHNHLNVT